MAQRNQSACLTETERKRREKLIPIFSALIEEIMNKRDAGRVPYDELQECIHVFGALARVRALFQEKESRNDHKLADFLSLDEQKKFFEMEEIATLKGFLGQPVNMLKAQMVRKQVPWPVWLEKLHKAYHKTEVIIPTAPQQWFSPLFSLDIAAIPT